MRALYDQACREARAKDGGAASLATLCHMVHVVLDGEKVLGKVGPADAEAPALSLAADPMAARRLYGIYLAHSFDDSEAAPADVVVAMLQMSAADEQAARLEVCQPRLRDLYADAIAKAEAEGRPLAEAYDALQPALQQLQLPREAAEAAALMVYKDRLALVAGRILKEPEKKALDAVRRFLDLSDSDVRTHVIKAFGKVYQGAVEEAMGRRDIMSPEGREALELLRVRLGLAEDDAEKIMYGVVDERLKNRMEGVQEAWERATYAKETLAQVWKDRGKDAGDDPNADGSGELGILEKKKMDVRGYELMVELTAIADLYTRNKVFREGDHLTHEEAYPVTVGRFVEDKTKEEMFGIYAWNAVTCQDSAVRETWTAAKPHVGGILGLAPERQQKVMVRMVSRWANMFIKQQIAEKGELGKEEISTLTNWVPTFFGIDEAVTADLVQSTNKGLLQSKVLRLLNQPKVVAADVQKLREDVETWDLSIQKDLELTKPQLRSLFRVEIIAALEDEALTEAEKAEAVEASQGSFGLTEKEAREELEDLVKARAQGYLVNAVGDLLQGNEAQAINEMQRLELVAGFAEQMDGIELKHQEWEVSAPMRQRLLKTYAASPLGAKKAPNVKLLGDALGVA